ncbi:MAG: ribosome small subunit-dependent GTPase A [Paludibacteraceae bacterium]|nr:ribosome small subunit-dependent GTPase A [Paludibacteraceae bacterium]
MEGFVIKNTGSSYLVRTADKQVFDCHLKGNFRIQGIKSTNPIAVGDNVEFDVRSAEDCLITKLMPRRNYIVRRPANLSKQLHIIAANLDAAMLVVTINHPVTSTVFIDRFLATCEAYNVPGMLLINKTDLYDDDEKEYMHNLMHLYEQIGYPCYAVSAKTGEGVAEVAELFKNKITLLSGNSGVGKSSFVNAINPDFKARTGDLSDVHDAGMHTTTFSEMFEIAPDSFIVDTPGIRGFGTIDFKKEEVGHYFPDIFRFSSDCRFGNCTHTHEPGCAVLKAVEEHYISESRYNSYLSIMDDENEAKYR